jgi:hypothetical protein
MGRHGDNGIDHQHVARPQRPPARLRVCGLAQTNGSHRWEGSLSLKQAAGDAVGDVTDRKLVPAASASCRVPCRERCALVFSPGSHLDVGFHSSSALKSLDGSEGRLSIYCTTARPPVELFPSRIADTN